MPVRGVAGEGKTVRAFTRMPMSESPDMGHPICGGSRCPRGEDSESGLVDEAAGDAVVGVDAAVAEEGPVAAGVFLELEVDLAD